MQIREQHGVRFAGPIGRMDQIRNSGWRRGTDNRPDSTAQRSNPQDQDESCLCKTFKGIDYRPFPIRWIDERLLEDLAPSFSTIFGPTLPRSPCH